MGGDTFVLQLGRLTIRRIGSPLLLCLAALAVPGIVRAREASAPRLNFYPSLQLAFVAGAAENYFRSHCGVVNSSGAAMTDLVIRQRFPAGFTPSLHDPDAQSLFWRPEGFKDTLEGNLYTVTIPQLRVAEATVLAVRLPYQGRPSSVTFTGVEVEFTQDGQRHSEKGPDQTWDLSKYTRYSGTIREFIKRYAGMDLAMPAHGDDWSFSQLAAEAAGRVTTGPVEIGSESAGRVRFSLQAGAPGTLRRILVIRTPVNPSRQLSANDEVRRYVLDKVQAKADFILDADAMSIQKKKLGRYDAWVADTRWRDRVKDRLGEGPSRWYVFTDQKGGNDYVINLSVQGRGVGPGKADVPNPKKEEELMAQLEEIVASLRIL